MIENSEQSEKQFLIEFLYVTFCLIITLLVFPLWSVLITKVFARCYFFSHCNKNLLWSL